MTPNNNSRIQVPMSVPDLSRPQEVRIGNQVIAGPMAWPSYLAVQTSQNQPPVLFTFGGLTKLEYGALLIAGSCVYATDQIPMEAVDLAAAILAECERRQKAEQAEKT